MSGFDAILFQRLDDRLRALEALVDELVGEVARLQQAIVERQPSKDIHDDVMGPHASDFAPPLRIKRERRAG